LRIALFTPFSPEIGGGAAQLRSHLQQLRDLDVHWHYLAKKPVSGNRWQWLGEPFTQNEFLSDLSARTGFLPGSISRVRHLVREMQADLYWIVAHYEGISVAAELIKLGKKVHVTVHDDPFATWIRSHRYTIFRPLLLKTFPQVLRSAVSIDVTSWGMRNLYQQKYGVKCFALYRHISELPKIENVPDESALTIGHIGTLYHPKPFRRFLLACKTIAETRHRKLRVIRIGASPEMDALAAQDPETFQSYGDLSEEKAIPLLASCELLYAMYPSGKKYELFRRTSLPIKISTYVQAQRPIFAHTPGDSTLACIVNKFKLGCVCEKLDEQDIARDLDGLLEESIPLAKYEQARMELMGSSQVQQLGAALRRENWQNFPEFDCPS
jgi:glycosyltransferase involved in cell wall biosynthesis